MSDNLLLNEIAAIDQEILGMKAAAEALTDEIRKAKNAHDDAAFKMFWDKREALFSMALEFEKKKTAAMRALRLAGKPIPDDALEPCRAMHRARFVIFPP